MTGGVVSLGAPRTSHLAVAGILLSLAAVVLIVAIDAVLLARGRAMQVLFSLLPLFLIVDLAGVGGLLVVRRPGNAIGALLLLAGVLTALAWGGGYYVDLRDFVGIGALPLVVPIAWMAGWVFTPTVGLMAAFLPMLYPSGHLPGRRWRGRVDRERAVVRLGHRLRDEVELDAIEDDVLGTVETTVRPAGISIWLRA